MFDNSNCLWVDVYEKWNVRKSISNYLTYFPFIYSQEWDEAASCELYSKKWICVNLLQHKKIVKHWYSISITGYSPSKQFVIPDVNKSFKWNSELVWLSSRIVLFSRPIFPSKIVYYRFISDSILNKIFVCLLSVPR